MGNGKGGLPRLGVAQQLAQAGKQDRRIGSVVDETESLGDAPVVQLGIRRTVIG